MMKQFTDLMTPVSWLCLVLGGIPPLIILFEPTWKEFLIVIAVDQVAFFLTQKFDQKFFLKFYPESKVFFPKVQENVIKNLRGKELRDLLVSLTLFPKRRALYVFCISFLKLFPSCLIILFYWQYEGTVFYQFLKFITFESIEMAFFYGVVFVEHHRFTSQKIAEFHKKYNWSSAFDGLVVPYSRKDFIFQENISLLVIAVFFICLQLVVFFSEPRLSPTDMAIKITCLGFIAIILFSRIWYLSRSFFMSGLEKIFQQFNHLGPQYQNICLPLHTSGILAKFEKTFNLMSKRIKGREQELSEWALYESENSRYKALGEISGLIAHDLGTPMHVMQFCVNELKENPELINDPLYLSQLSENIKRSVELVNTLRAYLKNPKKVGNSTSFEEAYEHALKLLKMQYLKQSYEKVLLHVDEDTMKLRISLSRMDLIHILYNLYKNSLDNLIENNIKDPKIEITTEKVFSSKCQILISDNGTGLTTERFEKMTGYRYFASPQSTFKEGLGLRLVRRLVERNKGELKVVDNNEKQVLGTQFLLTIPLEVHSHSHTHNQYTLSESSLRS